MEILRKITIKAIAGKIDIEKLIGMPEKKMPLARIFGIANKATPDAGDYGAFVRFHGQFRAINLETGVEYQAGTLLLPPIAQDMLGGVLAGDAESVRFGFDISVRFDNDAVTKYVYEIKPLVEASEDDPLSLLAKQVNKDFPMIENKAAETEKPAAKK